MSRPFILGLTGSIGMGKSTVAAMFAALDVPVFDADAVVRRMQGKGGQLVPLIEAAFPRTTGPEGVDRGALGRMVFKDEAALARLEAIVHPAVKAARDVFLLEHAGARLVIFDIPLLYETGSEAEVDEVAVVSAPASVQRQRVLARPGMTMERFARVLALQMADVEKRMRADHVINTGCPPERTRAAVGALVDKLPP